jgi:RNA polymerase sigma-70 factor (ECF subfamily)
MFAKLATFGVRFRHFPVSYYQSLAATEELVFPSRASGRSSLLALERLAGQAHVFAARSAACLRYRSSRYTVSRRESAATQESVIEEEEDVSNVEVDEVPLDEAWQCDDSQLVRRILHGDQDAYRHIVVRYETRVLAYLTYVLGEYELARDVAQEVFVAAYTALGQWHGHDYEHADGQVGGQGWNAPTLAPWLYRIATNRALNVLRAQKSRGGLPSSLTLLPERLMSEHSLEDQVVRRELLTAALRELSAEDATCLVLRVIAGEHYADIAQRLGLTSEAVRKRVARGLVALRAAYHALDVEAHL